jgi:hypothetical protein
VTGGSSYDGGVTSPEPPSRVESPDWLVKRDGSADEVLAEDGTWGTIETARWFSSHDEAASAKVPKGTSGTPIQQHPDAKN